MSLATGIHFLAKPLAAEKKNTSQPPYFLQHRRSKIAIKGLLQCTAFRFGSGRFSHFTLCWLLAVLCDACSDWSTVGLHSASICHSLGSSAEGDNSDYTCEPNHYFALIDSSLYAVLKAYLVPYIATTYLLYLVCMPF